MRLKMRALIKWMSWYLISSSRIRFVTSTFLVATLHAAIILPFAQKVPPPLRPMQKPITVTTTIVKKPKLIQKKVVPKKRKVVPVTRKVRKKKAPVKKIIKKVSIPKKQPLSVPRVVTPKSVAQPKEKVKQIYMQSLLSLLAESFELPEIGTVLAKLTIQKDGSLKNLAIVKSESIKNSAYIENHLRQLDLPPFNGELKQYDEETFEITFRNKL